ncbi:MAG: alpha-L-rhamnosidase [Paenibacillaceae bacterium]|nr:alpha-L-rhamnosidase [Paenibacillaceae bacterium]
MTGRTEEHLPVWLWHAEREARLTTVLSRTFAVSRDIAGFRLFIALTGGVQVEWNGRLVAELPEHPRNVTAFRAVEGLPDVLTQGEHTIRLRIACAEPMPVSPVSIHLWQRTVGCAVYAVGDGFWLASDERWLADDEPAAAVCLYGEEPYGDLDGAPEWFVRGGFGDIAVEPLVVTEAYASDWRVTPNGGGGVRLAGDGAGSLAFALPESGELHQFYHLRKQQEWKEARALLAAADPALLRRARFDLGREYNARIRAGNGCNVPLTVVWQGAESPEELARYDACITESFRVGPGETYVTLPQGMRYVDLYLVAARGEPVALDVAFESAGVPLVQAGRFNSDNALANRIYDVSVHTNRICHQLGLWDGVKRDRLNWAYDFYLAGKADFVLWDDLTVLRRSIRELGAGTPYGSWMNSIESYTLWWVVGLWEYYWFTGDAAFLYEIREDIRKHVRWIADNVDPADGRLRLDGERAAFIEWVPIDAAESRLALHAALVLAQRALEKLAAALPQLELPPGWPASAPDGDELLRGQALITPLLGIAAGCVGAEEARRFLREVPVADPLTTISAYWLAECCSLYGLPDKAWEVVSRVWGGMLARGATTFWESVTLEPAGEDAHDSLTTYTSYGSYRTSLCHAWSSTPVQWLSRFVLGVEPASPGYRTVRFRPQPVGGMTACSGRVVTPFGPIAAEWALGADGVVDSRLQLPDGVVLEGGDG